MWSFSACQVLGGEIGKATLCHTEVSVIHDTNFVSFELIAYRQSDDARGHNPDLV
jgi:hypothetical protein